MYKQPGQKKQADEMSVTTAAEDGDEGDDDVPRVDMNELLEDFDELTMEDQQ